MSPDFPRTAVITDQPANTQEDLRKVTDAISRVAGLGIEDSGGKVTFAWKAPVANTGILV